MVYPSKLIENEKEMLRTQIHQFLLSTGFRTGIFHVEARIQNSAMEYNKVDGVTDLRLKSKSPAAQPKVFILEVNVRCPGWMVIWATAYAYGIDYAAFQMLSALGDGERAKALAQPFAFGHQATVESVFVPTPRGGRLGPVGVCEELALRRPDLMAHVVRIQTMAQPGESVPDPRGGTLSFVAAFNLASNAAGVSRTEILRVGQNIRKCLRIDIE
jgi:biotin carboxylase